MKPHLLYRNPSSRTGVWLAATAIIAVCACVAFSQTQAGPSAGSQPAESAGPHISQSAHPAASAPASRPTATGEFRTKELLQAIAPALVAIVLSVVTRQVIVSLTAGIFVGAALILGAQGVYSPIRWVMLSVDKYLFEVLAPLKEGAVNYEKLKILVFTFFIGAMVGVIEANGGTRAMVARVTRRVRTREHAQTGASLAGVVVFFDDYANCMIVGPSMRPIFDRLKISRAKLAYIVDSTAAPVSSIFIGTWLAAEISYLNEGFNALGGHMPEFLRGLDGSAAFWASIPYRMYAILAIVMVLLISITGRDFGAMRKAEAKAWASGAAEAGTAEQPRVEDGNRWWLGAVPVATLVGLVVALLFYTGWQTSIANNESLGWAGFGEAGRSIKTILGNAESYFSLVYGSLAAAVLAVVMSLLSRALTLAKTMEAVVAGMSRMFAACIILVLAWGLSQIGQDLNLGQEARAFLEVQVERGVFSVTLLPLAVFVTACIISFATGTSWGTMGILCPAVIPIAAGLLDSMPADQAMPLFYATVGAVLAGAVFGDHCSPISDTTVLSAIASECELSRHVWTQMPYAITVAIVGMISMDGVRYAVHRWAPQFYQSYSSISWAYGLTLGAFLLLLILLVFGRRPKSPAAQPFLQTGA